MRLAMEMSLQEHAADEQEQQLPSAQPSAQPPAQPPAHPPAQPEAQPPVDGAAAASAINIDDDDDEMMAAVDEVERAKAAAAAGSSEVISLDEEAYDYAATDAEAGVAAAPLALDGGDLRTRYRLCATVWHAGAGASSGHYIADVRQAARARPDGAATAAAAIAGGSGGEVWQRFDDSFVRPVAADAPEALTKGYLYFFVHDSLLGAS